MLTVNSQNTDAEYRRYAPFPLEVSDDGRYLVDSYGAPFLVAADTAWSMFTELDLAGLRRFLDDRRARGINALRVQVSSPFKFDAAQSMPAAVGASNALPFTLNDAGGAWTGAADQDGADFSSPSDTYWNWVDVVFREAAARGIVLIADYAYMGFDAGSEGWWGAIGNAANTQAVCLAFGQYLGARWKSHENLIIALGTDMFPTSASEASARFLKILDGLQSAGCTQLVTAQYGASSDALDYSDYSSRITLNGVYPQLGSTTYPTHGRCRRAYNRSPAKPALMLESDYEGTGDAEGTENLDIMWGSFLSTNCGVVVGNSTLWKFLDGWEDELNSQAMQWFATMVAFLRSVEWQKLIPRGLGGIADFVTAGGGSAQTLGSVGTADTDDGNDWVAAAVAADGRLLVAYRPEGHAGTFTLDMTVMVGTTVRRWFNPQTGAYTSAGANIPNTGTQEFTPPDGDPWVLRLDA